MLVESGSRQRLPAWRESTGRSRTYMFEAARRWCGHAGSPAYSFFLPTRFFVDVRSHRGEDTRNLALKFCEFHVDDGFARMQHDIDGSRESAEIEAYGFAHAPLDAIALDSFPEHAACSETHARSRRRDIGGRS